MPTNRSTQGDRGLRIGAIARRFGATSIAAASVWLLTGCVAVVSNFAISGDGTVDIRVEAVDTNDEPPVDAAVVCGELSDAVGIPATVTTINQDGLISVACDIANVPIPTLARIGDQVSGELAGESLVQIDQSGGTTLFVFRIDGLSDALASGAQLRVTASAPGSLDVHNATSTDGSTASWRVTADSPFVAGEIASMHAVWTSPNESIAGWPLVGLSIVTLLLGSAVVLAISSRRNRRTTAGV